MIQSDQTTFSPTLCLSSNSILTTMLDISSFLQDPPTQIIQQRKRSDYEALLIITINKESKEQVNFKSNSHIPLDRVELLRNVTTLTTASLQHSETL